MYEIANNLKKFYNIVTIPKTVKPRKPARLTQAYPGLLRPKGQKDGMVSAQGFEPWTY